MFKNNSFFKFRCDFVSVEGINNKNLVLKGEKVMLKIYRHKQLKTVLTVIFGFCLIALYFYDCASSRPQSSVAQYQFNFNNESYRIRSIFAAEKNERYNELIGKDFLAIDFDQDRIIDRISVGNASLSKAQEIYDYGLEMLTKENKIKELNPANQKYTEENADFFLELKSFYPANAKPFNEFKIVSKKQLVNPEIIVAIDYEADGTLDEVLKGMTILEKVQAQYSNLIKSGLQKNGLIKVDNTILVKK